MAALKKDDLVRSKVEPYLNRMGIVETRRGDFVAVNLAGLLGAPVCFRADELELVEPAAAPETEEKKP